MNTSKPTEKNSLGSCIRKRRVFLGLTLKELGLKVWVSQPHLSRIEKNERMPSPDILRNLSKEIGVSYISLLLKAGYLTEEDIQELKAEVSE